MKKLALAVALAATFGGAQAATIDTSASGLLYVDDLGTPGNATAINGANSFSGYDGQPAVQTGYLSQGFFGSLWTIGGGNTINFTFLGQESGYTNSFLSIAGNLFEFNAIGTTVSYYVGAAQQLDFSFYDADSNLLFSNGTQQNSVLGFAIIPAAANSGYDYYIGFNDGYDADADYDDFVVGVSAVPLPAAGLLFGSTLLGAGLFGRRKQKVVQQA